MCQLGKSSPIFEGKISSKCLLYKKPSLLHEVTTQIILLYPVDSAQHGGGTLAVKHKEYLEVEDGHLFVDYTPEN